MGLASCRPVAAAQNAASRPGSTASEAVLTVTLPATYKHFLMAYAHHTIGTYEPFQAVELADQVRAAWAYGVPQHLLPFVECNGDYFCFDMRVRLPEPPVVLCAHDGQCDEIWPTFAAWVKEERLPSAE